MRSSPSCLVSVVLLQLYMFVFGWGILLLEAKSQILPKKIVEVQMCVDFCAARFKGVH